MMEPQLKSIFGIFHSWTDAKAAVDEFHRMGFSDRDVSLLVHAENVKKGPLSPEKHTKSAPGLAAGAATGAVLGGGLGLLAGIGSLVIPGIGPLIAFGPILTALTGAGMGVAAGSVAGVFIGVGIPKHKVDEVQAAIGEGSILVSVHVEDLILRKSAFQTLEKCGATSISTSEYGAISSIDDLTPSFNVQSNTPKEDFLSRKQF